MTCAGNYSQVAVAVTGGDLAVHSWGEGQETTILALHGITGTGAVMRALGEDLCDAAHVLAPDLRGRGGSEHLPGPYGLDTHVEDLVALLDHVDASRAVVVGHSLGAAIGTHLAIHAPDRVSQLILIDGGPLIPLPPGVSPDDAAAAMLGPSLQRLHMTFASRDAYYDYWREHPALADAWGPHVEWFLDNDLTGEEPALRSCVSEEAVRADGIDVLTNATLHDRFGEYGGPVHLIRAPRDLMNRPQPLLPDVVVDLLRVGWPLLRDSTVPDVNHYTILLSDHGALALSTAVRNDLAGSSEPAVDPAT
jgi:lipase